MRSSARLPVQEALGRANGCPSPRATLSLFRIGVHVGDVMVSGGDLLGDGVNIAARLQSLAEPGGICISEATHAICPQGAALGFDDLGPQMVKNIEEPIRVFAVSRRQPGTSLLDWSSTRHLPFPTSPRLRCSRSRT